jgi:hypothetical protein
MDLGIFSLGFVDIFIAILKAGLQYNILCEIK